MEPELPSLTIIRHDEEASRSRLDSTNTVQGWSSVNVPIMHVVNSVTDGHLPPDVNRQHSPLFTKLPPELRQQIFHIVLRQHVDNEFQHHVDGIGLLKVPRLYFEAGATSLLRACRAVYIEAQHVLALNSTTQIFLEIPMLTGSAVVPDHRLRSSTWNALSLAKLSSWRPAYTVQVICGRANHSQAFRKTLLFSMLTEGIRKFVLTLLWDDVTLFPVVILPITRARLASSIEEVRLDVLGSKPEWSACVWKPRDRLETNKLLSVDGNQLWPKIRNDKDINIVQHENVLSIRATATIIWRRDCTQKQYEDWLRRQDWTERDGDDVPWSHDQAVKVAIRSQSLRRCANRPADSIRIFWGCKIA